MSIPQRSAAVYSQFLKMIKMGVPKGAVKHKLRVSGADPAMADLPPDTMVPLVVIAPKQSATAKKTVRRRLAWKPVPKTQTDGGTISWL